MKSKSEKVNKVGSGKSEVLCTLGYDKIKG